MTNFSQAQNLPTLEVPREWQAAISRTRPGWWPIRYSWVPALVCVVDAFLIITTAVVADVLYSSVQETNADLTRYASIAIVVAAIFVPTCTIVVSIIRLRCLIGSFRSATLLSYGR